MLLYEVRSPCVLTSPQLIATCGLLLRLPVIASLLTLDSSTQMIVIVQFTKKIQAAAYPVLQDCRSTIGLSPICLVDPKVYAAMPNFRYHMMLPIFFFLSVLICMPPAYTMLLITQICAALCVPQSTVLIVS